MAKEYLFSNFENHLDARRNMELYSATTEFDITLKCPNIDISDSVMNEAMDFYWNTKA